MASQKMCVVHPYRFPSCTRVFSHRCHRQGMSRHMAKVYGAAEGSYKVVITAIALDTRNAPACATAPSTSLSGLTLGRWSV